MGKDYDTEVTMKPSKNAKPMPKMVVKKPVKLPQRLGKKK